jgi:hypothetical protein
MGTVTLRPTSTNSNSFTLTPTNYAAHQCINEVTADDASSQLSLTASSTDWVYAKFKGAIGGTIPSGNNRYSKLTLYVRAKKATIEATKAMVTVTLFDSDGNKIMSITPTLTGTYATYGTVISVDWLVFPELTFELSGSANGNYDGKTTNAGELDITQVYLDVAYNPLCARTGYIKVGDSWRMLSGIYSKENGVWKDTSAFDPKINGTWKGG